MTYINNIYYHCDKTTSRSLDCMFIVDWQKLSEWTVSYVHFASTHAIKALYAHVAFSLVSADMDWVTNCDSSSEDVPKSHLSTRKKKISIFCINKIWNKYVNMRMDFTRLPATISFFLSHFNFLF